MEQTAESKRLYVFSSFHHGRSMERNLRFKNEETLEVRLRFMEALALRVGNGNYFSDSLDACGAEYLNALVDELPTQTIARMNQSMPLGDDGFGYYPFERVAHLFSRLKKRGIVF